MPSTGSNGATLLKASVQQQDQQTVLTLNNRQHDTDSLQQYQPLQMSEAERQQQQQERHQQMLQTQQKVYKCLAESAPSLEKAEPASFEEHRDTGEVAR